MKTGRMMFVSDMFTVYYFVVQLPVMLEAIQGILARFLMTLFLGIALAAGTLHATYDNLRVEEWRTVFVLCLVEQDVFEGYFVLLAPL